MNIRLTSSILLFSAIFGLGACSGGEDTEDVVIDPPVTLPPPDLTGVDLAAAFEEAFVAMGQIDVRAPWAGHLDGLNLRQPGCPDIYAGNPDIEGIDLNTRNKGMSWADFCDQSDGTTFGGFEYWEIAVSAEGDETTGAGRTTEASRLLFGDGFIGRGDEALFEFDGEATDGLSFTKAANDYYAWTYSSRVEGTVTGTLPFGDTDMAGGYRTDLIRRATGGVDQGLEATGNVFFFERRMQGRFDSIGADLEIIGPEAAGPDDCALEPQGWIAIRDEDAYWYDLVFSPRFDGDPNDPNYPNEPYSECDGCGTLYVRGLEQDGIEVCLDLDFLWDGMLAPPELQEFAFTLRDPGEDR
ncbi:MAG: hypothetical protein AB8H79_13530 [Myxococcota bacterium]